MRKPSDFLYYVAGTLCLVFSIFLLFQSDFSPINLTNRIYFERPDRSYRDFYQSDLPLHRNNLRQAAVYLPIYSITEYDDIWPFIESFGMEGAEISQTDEYFLIQDGPRTLRIYEFLDLLEFEQHPTNPLNETIDDDKAKAIAKDFVKQNLLIRGPYEIELKRADNKILINIIQTLGKIANRAFPSEIVMDYFGNILFARHFYFEYEELGRGDLMTASAAMAALPRNHSGKARITAFELAYVFSESILQPAYVFHGYYPCGQPFSHFVTAIKNYH
jgi:hypothetical protein